ncbi:MAG: DUF1284 domain-containing protein [Niameybacter sp.]|uniref:DUF1284 domain-containing protein n=1 Tax=Niameybacter sp. TaxID=2033640 RepID=UPI002FC6282E
MEILKLRPHHINCIFFYEGRGYSQKFVENMDQVVAYLLEHFEQNIILEKSIDHLCKDCPNLVEAVCKNDSKIELLDKETLKQYNLQEQQVYTFKEIVENIYSHYNEHTFSKICSSCEWYKQGVCSKEKIAKQKHRWKC